MESSYLHVNDRLNGRQARIKPRILFLLEDECRIIVRTEVTQSTLTNHRVLQEEINLVLAIIVWNERHISSMKLHENLDENIRPVISTKATKAYLL